MREARISVNAHKGSKGREVEVASGNQPNIRCAGFKDEQSPPNATTVAYTRKLKLKTTSSVSAIFWWITQ